MYGPRATWWIQGHCKRAVLEETSKLVESIAKEAKDIDAATGCHDVTVLNAMITSTSARRVT